MTVRLWVTGCRRLAVDVSLVEWQALRADYIGRRRAGQCANFARLCVMCEWRAGAYRAVAVAVS